MTRSEEVYVQTLNLLGSDVPDKELQEIIDHEHALADPAFARTLAKRYTQQRLVVS